MRRSRRVVNWCMEGRSLAWNKPVRGSGGKQGAGSGEQYAPRLLQHPPPRSTHRSRDGEYCSQLPARFDRSPLPALDLRPMKWNSFGRSGLKVTELCLGTMTLAGQADEETSFAILDAAFEGGIRFLDTADCYPIPIEVATGGRTETLLGRWMKERKNRDQLVVATKAYFAMGPLPIHRGNSRAHLKAACEASLRRLGTEYA